MNVGDKIQFIKTIREHWVLQAKTGQTGIITEIENNKKIKIRLTNDNIVSTDMGSIKPYEKHEKFNIKQVTNEKLLDKFETLVAHQWQTNKTQTKSYQKMINDIERIRIELLSRLNN